MHKSASTSRSKKPTIMENKRRSHFCSPMALQQSTLLFILSLYLSIDLGLSDQAAVLRRFTRERWLNGNKTSSVADTCKDDLIESVSAHFRDRKLREYEHPEELLRQRDKIKALPGQPPVDFDQYGGYITVSAKTRRSFYYYFVEAAKDKENLPLMLWLNGGPGCSSLGYGAFQEIGPFRVASDGKTLYRNEYAWNKVANVLFLETPAGVGFSHSNSSEEMHESGDIRVQVDNYVFLRHWLERFPEYRDRQVYLAGESYAGHYIPQLAEFILHMNYKNKEDNFINLLGAIMGNPVLSQETDMPREYDYFLSHGLISERLHQQVYKWCDFTPLAPSSQTCGNAIDQIDALTQYSLDLYNIYYPQCKSPNVTATPKKESKEFDPCSKFYVEAYLNNPQVQQAMHAIETTSRGKYNWQHCNKKINWGVSPYSVLYLIESQIMCDLRVWIYSGDTDGVVPFVSTRSSITMGMNVYIKTSLYPWEYEGEVGGYVEEYDGVGRLTFATVRNAGHQVPSFQPGRALTIVSHFLNNTPLPKRAFSKPDTSD